MQISRCSHLRDEVQIFDQSSPTVPVVSRLHQLATAYLLWTSESEVPTDLVREDLLTCLGILYAEDKNVNRLFSVKIWNLNWYAGSHGSGKDNNRFVHNTYCVLTVFVIRILCVECQHSHDSTLSKSHFCWLIGPTWRWIITKKDENTMITFLVSQSKSTVESQNRCVNQHGSGVYQWTWNQERTDQMNSVFWQIWWGQIIS